MKHSHPLLIGNWKLNPGTVAEAKTLFQGIGKKVAKYKAIEVIVAAPFLFIPELAKSKQTQIGLGSQDAHFEERGACTGEISPALLAPYKVTHVIVGHSERRALGESDEQVNKKIQTILKRKMTPVVCIGEKTRDEQGSFYNVIENQIRKLAAGLTATQITRVVIAYEPIWAIGTGATATAEDVKEMQLFVVSVLTKLYDRKVAARIKLLYGGSVKSSNAAELYAQGGMNGFLVGGASLSPEEFGEIARVIN